jgi:hypothetical protein
VGQRDGGANVVVAIPVSYVIDITTESFDQARECT